MKKNRIELVNEVAKALESCEHAEDGSEFCGSCPLMGPVLNIGRAMILKIKIKINKFFT